MSCCVAWSCHLGNAPAIIGGIKKKVTFWGWFLAWAEKRIRLTPAEWPWLRETSVRMKVIWDHHLISMAKHWRSLKYRVAQYIWNHRPGNETYVCLFDRICAFLLIWSLRPLDTSLTKERALEFQTASANMDLNCGQSKTSGSPQVSALDSGLQHKFRWLHDHTSPIDTGSIYVPLVPRTLILESCHELPHPWMQHTTV